MAAIKYIFAKDVTELEAIQASAVKAVGQARVKVQIAAVATLQHAAKHGDWTFAGKLVTALGNTVNGKALIEFFKVYGGLKTDETGFIGWSGAKFIEDKFQEAKAKMWWELKVSNPFAGWSLEDRLQQILKEHKTIEAKLLKLDDADKAKVKMDVNDATLKAVLKLCKFEAIIAEEPANDVADAA
ncbi:hypothetical protein D3C71_480000 [compost metagenome]